MRIGLLATIGLALLVPAAGMALQDPTPVPTGASLGYRLQSGDVIQIKVWQHEELSGSFLVNENGDISYPLLGDINLRDMTVSDLRERIKTGLGSLYRNPFVTVTPQFRMTVMGEVNDPGLFTVDPTLSVLDVIAMAGGATTSANLGKIRVVRGGEEMRVEFQQAARAGRSLEAQGVRSGDQIFVPRKFFTRDDLVILFSFLNVMLTAVVLVRQ